MTIPDYEIDDSKLASTSRRRSNSDISFLPQNKMASTFVITNENKNKKKADKSRNANNYQLD